MRTFAVAAVLLAASAARAQSLYVAADPLPYALKGFSAHLGVVLPGDRFSLEAAAFSSELGDTLLTLVQPADSGFRASLRGLTAEGYWHFARSSRNAFLAGLQVHFDRFDVKHEAESVSTRVDQIYVFPTLAFLWFPFDALGLFLKPFISAGLPLLSRDDVHVGNHTFEQLRVFPLATVIVGYRL